MKTGLSAEEKHAFVEMIFSMTKDDLRREHSVDDIKARPLAGVKKGKLVDYIPSYAKNGYIILNENTEKFTITFKGLYFFQHSKESSERRADQTRYVVGMKENF